MPKRRIPVALEVVNECTACNPSACCVGRVTLKLTRQEAQLMRDTGNALIETAAPQPFYRERVPYPIGYTVVANGVVRIHCDPECETQPLEAGFGRYIMPNRCTNLQTDLLGRTACSIYTTRPQSCVDFEPGSEPCHQMQIRRNRNSS